MSKFSSEKPIIICCDDLQEQERIRTLLAHKYRHIIGCRLAQLDTTLTGNPEALVIAGWQQPSAELRLIIELCRHQSHPLLIILRQFSSLDINRLPEKTDYVLMPRDSGFCLQPWLEQARLLRQSFNHMEQKIVSLTNKMNERKVVEKAKGLLMKCHQVDEDTAYKAMRNSAMQSGQSLSQIAKNLINTLQTFE
ncbi:ANTAR domain-containing protein [Vibrio albus]|uniref:ANTAR domain-containing protein n=1 Tax=Vibrio albus TaxID=2200953 RepID=A0A2U3BC08_9VIBR|nr:ANTAR domain-containing protein [Vibrio albus]PWI34264.1 ANTAR domain-containing protein [Vibrio albus]